MGKGLNIELVENNPDWKLFRTQCDCNLPNHDLWVEIEYDKDFKILTLIFNYKVIPKDLLPDSFWDNPFKRFWKKIKLIGKILFNQTVEFEEAFSFRGQRHIDDFCDQIYLLSRDCVKETNELEDAKQEIKKLKRELEKRSI